MSKQVAKVIDMELSTADALNAALETPALDPVLLKIANSYIAGQPLTDIAEELNVSLDRVSAVLQHKDVQRYVDNAYLTHGYMDRMKRAKLISRVIDAKLQEALETGIYSKEDLLSWMKLADQMDKTARPKDKSPTVAVQVNNNYDNLMQKLLGTE